MNYTAIRVDDYWAIVSDEKPENKDDIYSSGYFDDNRICTLTTDWDYSVLPVNRNRKVIATSKKISDELPLFDVPGWDDSLNVELAMQQYVLSQMPLAPKSITLAWYAGFSKAKEKYQFTLGDIKNAIQYGVRIKDFDADIDDNDVKLFTQTITKPKQYQVEIEMEESNEYIPKNPEGDIIPNGSWKMQPKITEGKIKIKSWKQL